MLKSGSQHPANLFSPAWACAHALSSAMSYACLMQKINTSKIAEPEQRFVGLAVARKPRTAGICNRRPSGAVVPPTSLIAGWYVSMGHIRAYGLVHRNPRWCHLPQRDQ